ncbi:MAG: imelysin family protein [Polyangiales bacterium]
MTRALALASALLLGACRPTPPPRPPAAQATLDVKDYLAREMSALERAARDLRGAAPAPDADGWNARDDADAVRRMRAAWGRMRDAYEHIEAAVVVLFPETDVAIDGRFETFAENGLDRDPFDGEGVTGMHAVERILWADAAPAPVLAFERSLREGAVFFAPAFPRDAREAAAFRDGLLRRLVDDIAGMRAAFAPLALDPAAAYRGVVSSMREQHEKVDLAATAEEESRYARRTLADMRANLAGGRALLACFRPWLRAAGHADEADDLDAQLTAVQARYDALPGETLPPVPEGWNPDAPTAAQRATPYGSLHAFLRVASAPDREGSLAARMVRAGQHLGIEVR